MEILRIDPEQRRRQLARLQQVRKERDSNESRASLENLERVARSTENMMPAILRCVEARCTTGEIADVQRRVFGIQKETIAF